MKIKFFLNLFFEFPMKKIVLFMQKNFAGLKAELKNT